MRGKAFTKFTEQLHGHRIMREAFLKCRFVVLQLIVGDKKLIEIKDVAGQLDAVPGGNR